MAKVKTASSASSLLLKGLGLWGTVEISPYNVFIHLHISGYFY